MKQETKPVCPKCGRQMVFVSTGRVGKIYQCFSCNKVEVVKKGGKR